MEIWKDVIGYEGLYQVSNQGNVKALERKMIYKNGKTYIRKEHLMSLTNSRGYKMVHLTTYEGKHVSESVHRLVAKAFIENPQNLPMINHKDENRSNNSVHNLEWCSAKYNTNYSWEKTYAGIISNCAVSVNLYEVDGTFIKTYRSLADAAHDLGISKQTVHNSCNKRSYLIKGKYIFTYANQELDMDFARSLKVNQLKRKVVQYSLDGEFIKLWNCAQEAGRSLGIDPSTIGKCCKNYVGKRTIGGFIWKYYIDPNDLA